MQALFFEIQNLLHFIFSTKQYLSTQIFYCMQPIIECVPNFSEGNDLNIINRSQIKLNR